MDGFVLPGNREGSISSNRSRPFLKRVLETDLEKKDRFTKVFQFFLPWVLLITVAVISVMMLTTWLGWERGKHLMDIWVFYTLPPAGKETIIPKAVAGGVPGWVAGLSTSFVDISVSLFLIWNYDWVKKIPILGPALKRAEMMGRAKITKASWFRHVTFAFCTFVVFVPFSGSGGIGGTIFGRVLGMNPYMVLLAVVIGSVAGSTGFALLSERLVSILAGTPFLNFINNLNMIQIVVVLIAIGFIIYAVRNPRMAAVRATNAVGKAIDATEKAMVIADKGRKNITKVTMNGTKGTLKAVGGVNRAIMDINMEVATKPMELMGSRGKEIAQSAKHMGKRRVDDVHKITGSAIDMTLDASEKAASYVIDVVGDLALEGLDQTRKGWEEAEKVIIKGGEKVEKILKKEGESELHKIDNEPEVEIPPHVESSKGEVKE